MATVAERVTNRLTKVPGVEPADVVRWVAEAEAESGFTEGQDEGKYDNALVHLSLHLAYSEISSDAARFFTYKDKDESVDKTKVFENYQQLAKQARLDYRRFRRGGYASQTHTNRADLR